MKISTMRQNQAGMTLIEILVALLIFSFGLLGFVGLQARAIQFSTGAEDSNRASLLANDLVATMVAKQTTQLANISTELSAWQLRASDPASGGLPNGSASAVVSGNVATVTIQWQPPNAASGAAPRQYVTEVVIP